MSHPTPLTTGALRGSRGHGQRALPGPVRASSRLPWAETAVFTALAPQAAPQTAIAA